MKFKIVELVVIKKTVKARKNKEKYNG